jgi:RNA polymerase sigma-70 factor (ECF subfamily)
VKQRETPQFPSNELTVNRPEGNIADLVARCQAGDVDAFAELYRQHAPRVFSLTCRMSGSTETGEDLLQEVFLQAHRKIHGFKGDSAVGTWLHRLAINHCLDFVRSRRVKMDKATDSLDRDGATAPGAAHDSPVERIDLERAIRRLPPGCREAFVLHDVEGYEHREIAQMLGIAEGTSKSQVFKARLKLRAVLA